MIWQRVKKFLPFLLILGGIGLVSLAFAADLILGGSQSGFGIRQKTITLIGVFILFTGIFLALPIGRRVLQVIYSPPERYRRPIPILLIAVWFGLNTGFGEVLILSYRKFLQDQVLNKARDFIWMVPLGDLIIFLGVGLIFYLVARRWKKLGALGITVFVFSFLGMLSWLLMFPNIHILASLLLSAGVAITISRYISVHEGRFYGFVRPTFPGLVVFFGILILGYFGWKTFEERLALARLPSESPNSPNVLLIVLDVVRAESLSVYGYEKSTTPNLENLAQKGVLFQNAFATVPWTLPSHFSMFTGLLLHEQSELMYTNFEITYPTLADVLSAQGYYSAGFVANTYYCSYEHGLDKGFVHYEDYQVSADQILLSVSLGREVGKFIAQLTNNYRLFLPKTAGDVNEDFLFWIDRHRDRPFFAFLNYMDAHAPYQPPKPFDTLFGSQKLPAGSPLELYWDGWNDDEVQAEANAYIDAYDGSIAYLDQQLGQLYSELGKRDLLENTLIIITSDHGEQFGEHSLFDHGNSLYKQGLHVPLLILYPNKLPEDTIVSSLVSLRDLPATVVELTGTEANHEFFGISFSRYWRETTGSDNPNTRAVISELNAEFDNLFPEWYPVNQGNMKSILEDDYHYILNGDGQEELYNFKIDPAEEFDLASQAGEAGTIERFRLLLDEFIAASIDPHSRSEGISLTDENSNSSMLAITPWK